MDQTQDVDFIQQTPENDWFYYTPVSDRAKHWCQQFGFDPGPGPTLAWNAEEFAQRFGGFCNPQIQTAEAARKPRADEQIIFNTACSLEEAQAHYGMKSKKPPLPPWRPRHRPSRWNIK